VEYLANLGFIWNFFSPAISDSIKERIKPKGSVDIAKKRGLRLYESLGELDLAIDIFINTFDAYLRENTREQQVGEDPVERVLRIHDLSCEVYYRTEDIVHALIELGECLKAINPQLEIHKPELANILHGLGVTESVLAEEIKVVPWNAPHPELLAVLEEARGNRNILHSAIKEYREFIAKEFPFKESF